MVAVPLSLAPLCEVLLVWLWAVSCLCPYCLFAPCYLLAALDVVQYQLPLVQVWCPEG